MTTERINGIRCDFESANRNKVVYLIYPEMMAFTPELIQQTATMYNVSIVCVYVPSDQWNNYLTPWAEPGEAKGFPPFAGLAYEFFTTLKQKIIPTVEMTLGMSPEAERDLIGVSLSGLFALWQWIDNDIFHSIASLSGSFWYAGFMEWFNTQTISKKSGKAYFLLGRDEPKAKIKAYQTVGVDTQDIINRLGEIGIDVSFQWVPGNHFANPLSRLQLAFTALCG